MTRASRRAFLEAEKSALGQALRTVTGVLERVSFEDRLNEVVDELAALEADTSKSGAEVRLVFHGRPVVESVGIEAGFASKALAAYQDLITRAAVPPSIMAASGPIRDSHLSRLHITNLVRGSFGFELRELQSAEPDSNSLGETVEESARLIAAAGSDDENFFDTIANYHPRVQQALATFFETVSSAGATFDLATNEITATFSTETVSSASRRLAAIQRLEDDEIEQEGILLGVLPHSRQFEFGHPESGEIWKGKIDRSVDAEHLTTLTNSHLRLRFRVSSWRRADGRVSRRYTLVSVDLPAG